MASARDSKSACRARPPRPRRWCWRSRTRTRDAASAAAATQAERVRPQARADAVERIDEDRARFLVIDLVILELERRYAAADSHFHASVTEMVENANLLDQAQRRVEREEVNQRTEPHARRRARQRAEIDAGHRHHIEGRRVMLRHVQAVDAGVIGRLGEGETLVEQGRKRPVAVLDVIEESDLHCGLGADRGDQWISGSGIWPLPAR